MQKIENKLTNDTYIHTQSVASVQEAGAATLRAAEDFVNRKIDDTAFREAVEHLYDTVRSIKTGMMK